MKTQTTYPKTAVSLWHETTNRDPRLVRMFHEHYSCNNRQSKIVSSGPTRTISLLHEPDIFTAGAAWTWCLPKIGYHAGKAYCMFFRRLTGAIASDLILAAEDHLPRELLPIEAITYIDPGAVTSSNPGYCFQLAGWTKQAERSVKLNLVIYKKTISL